MILERRRNIRSWGLICVPLILYSTFAFIGIVMILFMFLIANFAMAKGEEKRVFFRKLFEIRNLLAFFVLIILAGYLAGNVLQPKPAEAAMELTRFDYTNYKTLFVLFHFAWMGWIALLFWKERKREFLYVIAISLVLFPCVSLGKYNDLCMRGSIPALFMLCVLVMRQLLSEKNRKAYRFLLLCALIASSANSQRELYRAFIIGGIHVENRKAPYSALTELMEGSVPVTYQYVDWNVENGINHWIVKRGK